MTRQVYVGSVHDGTITPEHLESLVELLNKSNDNDYYEITPRGIVIANDFLIYN